jgi:hypothetical protein
LGGSSKQTIFFFLARLEHVMVSFLQALCWSDSKNWPIFQKKKTGRQSRDHHTKLLRFEPFGLSKDVFPGLEPVGKVCLRFIFLCEKVKA